MNMTNYRERLTPWVVVRLLPRMQHVDVAQFHKCSDAEGYAQALRQLQSDCGARYVVMFDAKADSAVETRTIDYPVPTAAVRAAIHDNQADRLHKASPEALG